MNNAISIIFCAVGVAMIGELDGYWDAVGVLLILLSHNINRH